jgi:xanthine dehydrogenase YagT iron-sulfur-binding subunit
MGRKRKNPGSRRTISRRGFLTTVGTAPIAGAAMGHALEAPGPAAEPHEPVNLVLKVNGRAFKLQVEPRDTLLSALREKLGMTGTKPGCERGECGACTVLIDGIPRYACLTLALEAAGREITTVEGHGCGGPVARQPESLVRGNPGCHERQPLSVRCL